MPAAICCSSVEDRRRQGLDGALLSLEHAANGRRVPSLLQTGTDVMALAIDLSDHQAQALTETAARLQVSQADLAAAAVRDLIAQPADDFDAAAERVLSKNAELYRRLA